VKRKWLLMTEEAPSGEETTIAEAEVSEALRKCTTQPVLIAAQRLRSLSDPTLTDQFIAESVFQTTGNPERTAINNRVHSKIEFIRKISSTIMSVLPA
jgi:hypothetical protein